MKYEAFYKKGVVRLVDHYAKPPFVKVDEFKLDPNPVIHYIGNDRTKFGPEPIEPMLFKLVETNTTIMVDHVEKLTATNGKPRPLTGVSRRLTQKYHQRYRNFRPLKRREIALEDKRVGVVFNYAILPHLHRYTRSALSHFWEWSNVFRTVMSNAVAIARTNNKPQFIDCYLPEKAPQQEELVITQKRFDRNGLSDYSDDWAFVVMALWNWLCDDLEPEQQLIPTDLTQVEKERIHFAWNVNGQLVIVRLADLDAMRSTADKQKFLGLIEDLVERQHKPSVATATTDAATATEEETVVDLGKRSPQEAIKALAETMAESGELTAAEYRRAIKLSEAHKAITNPFGQGTLEELAGGAAKAAKTRPTGKMATGTTNFDKTVGTSSIIDIDKVYVKEMMQGDIAGMVIGLQKSGIPITDFKVEEVKDVANHYINYRVKFVPFNGKESTVHFQIPVVRQDGSFIANGTKCRMDRQRIDMPIRKVRPDRVALTSYYGKVFIDRDERATNNYGRWLGNRLAALDAENPDFFEALSASDTFAHEIRAPRVYTALASRFDLIRYKGMELNFNHGRRDKYATEEQLKKLERGGIVVCGKSKDGSIITIDENDIFYQVKDGKTKELGNINELFDGHVGVGPVEISVAKIRGKRISLGLILAYHYGLKGLLRKLKTEYRKVPKGTRVELDESEFSVVFADETLVVSRGDREASLILAGLNQFKNSIKRYSISDFNNKSVYLNVLDGYGLGTSHLREIDLMIKMFVDPITEEILEDIKEPETLEGLLFRANSLLTTDEHPREADLKHMRIRGYERFAGLVYAELVKSIRDFESRSGKNRKVEMNPRAVWMGIVQDPSLGLCSDINPVNALKERERVSYSGLGGRSSDTMVKRNREFHPNDRGVISEASPDSGKVGVVTYMSADPNFKNMRGVAEDLTADNTTMASQMSTTAMLLPMSDQDDPKRMLIL